MSKRPTFIPGRPAGWQPPLARYRPQQPKGAAAAYVRELAPPDGLVVDLFCHGPRFVGEAAEAGRRALGFSVNPLLLHAARAGLQARDHQAISAGYTRLADSPRGETTLSSHLASAYRTVCPVCRSPGVAEWFAWRRDADGPFEKSVRCQSCGRVEVGPADRDDVALAQSFAPRGLPYYYALDRAAPLGDPARERAAELVECYTPRNLSALMDVSRRVGAIQAADGVRLALTTLLLDCFDRCSKLDPYDEERPRPRTLRIPVRYVERNVWLCLEEGLSALLENGAAAAVSAADDVDRLVRGESKGYALDARAARDVGEVLPARAVDLMLVDPPRPDGAFWALSALWAAWLWDASEAQVLRPFLRRRRFDWDWHWRVLRRALGAVGPLLADDGSLVMLFSASEPELLRSACMAATGAGYGLRGWGYAAEVGYRLAWRWEGGAGFQGTDVERLDQRMGAEAGHAAVDTLVERCEPSCRSLLETVAHVRLADRGLLAQLSAIDADVPPVTLVAEAVDQGLDAAPVLELEGTRPSSDRLLWLDHPPREINTLADRVELLVRNALGGRPVWREDDLINAVYADLPGGLTPDLHLVRVCIASYATRQGEELGLRKEDNFERRDLEIAGLRNDLVSLGERLGFRVAGEGDRQVAWRMDEGAGYVFRISATASLAPLLLEPSVPEPDVQRCLVVPGGRAELIHLKLQRDPRLRQAVDAGMWKFLKFRHLRRLVAEEDLDRHILETVLGLDPIAEQEHTQLPLF